MFNLVGVFSPGFEKVIPSALKKVLPDAKNAAVSSGFIRFSLDKNPLKAVKADFLNNSFLVIKEWNVNQKPNSNGNPNPPSFESMAKNVRIPPQIVSEILKEHYKSFRVRFSKENQFTSVNKQITANVEKTISNQTGLSCDRLGGDTEFWFLTRSNGYACFALRITKKQSTEKYLEKGELRPEFVTLLAEFAGAEQSDCFLDPFAGHGGIIKQLSKLFPKSQIYASEIENDLIQKLKKQQLKKNISLSKCDATSLSHIPNNSIDCVITDPPWGFYQGDLRDDKKLASLYSAMLKEFYRVTKKDGKICVLTAAKEIFENCFDESEFGKKLKGKEIRNDVLVNGKKSAVYVWKV